jgi:hypothetical protein
MASHERRIRAVAAVSPPYSADIYWNVTLASMRRELASLYGITEEEMGASVGQDHARRRASTISSAR